MEWSQTQLISFSQHQKRVRYRANYRGIKEIEVLLEQFLAVHAQSFTPDEWQSLETLLELPDQTLYKILSQPILSISDLKDFSATTMLSMLHQFAQCR